MLVVALDTTTRAGSIALVSSSGVVEERAGDGARNHAARLPGEITSLLRDRGVSMRDVELYAVASGPGSFTGLRIGIATIQGLAFVHRRRAIGVSALEALAYAASAAFAPGTIIAAMIDAHRREVFAAAYRVGAGPSFGRERVAEIEAPAAGAPAPILQRWAERHAGAQAVCVGDGASLYAEEIGRVLPAAVVVPAPLLAGTIGQLAVERREEAVEARGLRALYVRRPDVELERERNASNQR